MAQPHPGVWGIDLGQCALKAVHLEIVDGKVTATAFDYIEHPKILSQPDADPDQLTREALEQFLSRNTWKGDTVVISVPGQSGLARFVKLPPVEEKKIADIVRFEAKQQIPFPLDEVVWDFQKIGSGIVTDGFAMETEIGLFAMKRDMVNRYLQHFTDVNVEVHLVQMAPLGLCNFVTYDLLGKEGAAAGEGGDDAEKKPCIVALDMGTDNSNLVITDGEKIIWQRPIPLGGNHFTRALTKEMKLTFAKAEHLKRNAIKSPDLKKILGALKPVLNDFVSEVQRSLGYFTNTHRDASIQYLIGLGNAFRLPGLQKYLQEKLQLEVRKLQKLERLAGDEVVSAPTFTENLPSFPVAYGLALQGLKVTRLQTNLLPREIRLERLIRAKKPWAAAAAAALLLAVAGQLYGKYLEAQNLKDPKITQKKDELKREINQANDKVQKKKAAIGEFNANVEAVKNIAGNVPQRDNWQLVTRYVLLALPRPDGANLNPPAYTKYVTKNVAKDGTPYATKAYDLLMQKRFTPKTGGQHDPKKAAADEENIRLVLHDLTRKPPAQADVDALVKNLDQRTKVIDQFIRKHLIQVNIEGICSMYSNDLNGENGFFKRGLDHKRLHGLEKIEQEKVKEGAADLPRKGWVFEVRGYTYHDDGGRFVENALLANLRPQADKKIHRFHGQLTAPDADAKENHDAVKEKKKKPPAKPAAAEHDVDDLAKGKTYCFLLKNEGGQTFRPYLSLKDADGKEIAGKRLGDDGQYSRMTFTPAKEGKYKVVAASLEGPGHYSLGIFEEERILRDGKLPLEEQLRIREEVTTLVSYFHVYKGWEEGDRVVNPQPGQFLFVRTSSLPKVLRGGMDGKMPPGGMPPGGMPPGGPPGQPGQPGQQPDMKDKEKFKAARPWKAQGVAAGTALAGGGDGKELHAPDPVNPPPRPAADGERAKRTEFVLFFIWDEKILASAEKSEP